MCFPDIPSVWLSVILSTIINQTIRDLLLTYSLDIEFENVAHVGGQLDEKHVPAPVAAGMGNDDGPHGHGGPHALPRDWGFLQYRSFVFLCLCNCT